MARKAGHRIVGTLSLVVLVFLYGFGAGALNWYPGSYVRMALVQGAAFLGEPDYVAPRIYERQGARTIDAGRTQPGFTLITSVWAAPEWTPGLRLIDEEGRIVHQWLIDPEDVLPEVTGAQSLRSTVVPVHGARLFPSGDILVNVEYAGAVRLDGCGRVKWVVPMRNHHSIALGDDGTLWIPITRFEERPSSSNFPNGYPGLRSDIYHDRILHLTADGEVIGEISVLDLLYSNELQRYLAKGRETLPGDILHLNDVEPLPREIAHAYPLFEAGDLLISVRNLDLVLVADPQTGKVKWHASEPFNQQHDPDFMGDGWIGVFDNNRDLTARGSMAGGTRIVAVKPGTDSLKVLFPAESPNPFYTAKMGKWQELPNGNLLLTEARTGRIIEVSPDGETVWEWIHGPYNEENTVEVAEGTRYMLSTEVIASWPCSDAYFSNHPSQGGGL